MIMFEYSAQGELNCLQKVDAAPPAEQLQAFSIK